MHGTVCKSLQQKPKKFMRSGVLQPKTSSLPVKKVYVSTLSIFLYDAEDKKETFAARAQTRAHHAVCAAEKRFNLGEEVTVLARAAERSAPPLASRYPCQRAKHFRTLTSRLQPELASRTSPRKKRSPSRPQKCGRFTIPALEPEATEESVLGRSRRERTYGREEHSLRKPPSPWSARR